MALGRRINVSKNRLSAGVRLWNSLEILLISCGLSECSLRAKGGVEGGSSALSAIRYVAAVPGSSGGARRHRGVLSGTRLVCPQKDRKSHVAACRQISVCGPTYRANCERSTKICDRMQFFCDELCVQWDQIVENVTHKVTHRRGRRGWEAG